MNKLFPLLALCTALGLAQRPPAYPLITHDPYFSIWSTTDELNGGPTRHWTGAPQEIGSLIRIDGVTYRLMGSDPPRRPAERTGPLRQVSAQVLPTRTIYRFEGAGVGVTLTFLTPALLKDLDVLSRPATYIRWDVRSTDGKPHKAALYFDATSQLVVDQPRQPVLWGRFLLDGNPVLRMGSVEQPVLQKRGDDLRIDWGYLYVTAPPAPGVSQVSAEREETRAAFIAKGRLPASDALDPEAPSRFRLPALAYAFDLGEVTAAPASRTLIVAYDDLYSIEYFQRRLRPYWRRKGATAEDMLRAALRDQASLTERCARFDKELMADLRQAGGADYEFIATLAYRQAIAAHKLVADIDGTPYFFSKENFSNGCIGTVDVTYPSAPLFLLMNPELLKGMIRPILDYASLERWRFPFAPHDLGTYPQANGQVYGGGERNEDRQMPVEETGNMLILTAALVKAENNAAFAERYWKLLTRWASYLKEKGLDPENQLSTDDFAGHLAHNANLSIKAILALGSYAWLCERTGHGSEAAEYRGVARDFARRWITMAGDGGHYRLAFDKPGTWSQKYNLVWDRLLGLDLFPPEVARKEVAFYRMMQKPYGLPLDNREQYTKLDWIVWSATLAESAADFEALVAPVARFLNSTPDRVPMSDWYWTHDAKKRGFQARSVVGGVFVKMLADPQLWSKWLKEKE
ncbi:MAG: DUF4965 domain-containing protein [Bryobacterales bacterium]|nr:DUF4965 domain-containing protein [Bryobacterales bacterium]